MGKKKNDNIIDLQQYRKKRENEKKKKKRIAERMKRKKRAAISPRWKMAITLGVIALIGILLAILTQII